MRHETFFAKQGHLIIEVKLFRQVLMVHSEKAGTF